jgi:hypothetical protein
LVKHTCIFGLGGKCAGSRHVARCPPDAINNCAFVFGCKRSLIW